MQILLYADDIVLLAKSAIGLQILLGKLSDWCRRWGLHINSTKTKGVHYRPKKVKRTSFSFRCGDQSINVCTKYKYLGLWFTDGLNFSYMARTVAAAVQRSFGLLIAKARCIGGLPYECYTKLYNSLVQSVIDYGVSICGHNSFSCN